jgi:hypothetical protein
VHQSGKFRAQSRRFLPQIPKNRAFHNQRLDFLALLAYTESVWLSPDETAALCEEQAEREVFV